MYDRYAGYNGRQQGDTNETIPAINAIQKFGFAVSNHIPPKLLSLLYTNLLRVGFSINPAQKGDATREVIP